MARLLFEEQAVRTRRGSLASGVEYVVYTNLAGTTLADISATSGGAATSTATVVAATSTVTTADITGLGPASLKFYGPDGVDTLYLRCPDDPDLGVQELEADPDERLDTLEEAGGGGIHPDLAAHDTLGLATDAELSTHAADTTSIHGIADATVLATDAEITSAVSTHEAAGNPHPVYETSVEAAAKVTAHEAAVDPHTGYVTDAGLATHTSDAANPHAVTKAQVGLGSVDNTSDVAKPVSTATQAALDAHTAAGDPHAVYETSVEAAAKVAAHEADTTSVHGITDTTALATSSSVTSAVSTHAGLTDPHTGYVLESLYDAKGDLLPASAADTPARLGVGANDTILTADSAAATGLKWAAPAAVTHPDLATHDALGLATDAELATHVAAANPHSVYATDTDLTAHEADTTGIHGIPDTSTLATTSGVTSAVSTHAGLADPHTGYVLESLYDAKGDLLAASADNTPAKLTAGANDTVLTADSTTGTGLKWAAPAAHPNLATHDSLGLATDAELATHAAAADPHTGYVLESLVDAKGDLIAGSAADTVARLAVGANDTILTADSAAGAGVKWAAPAAASGTAGGDLSGTYPNPQIGTGVIVNADVNAAAAIAYAKLALAASIVNADVASGAAIAYSKLALTGAILNADLAGSIAYSKLALTGAILNADLAGSIAYSKLALTGAILNADLAGSIAYSKLSLTGAILNADLAGSIALSKLAVGVVEAQGGGKETFQAHGAMGSTETFDLANGNLHTGTLDAACTFTFTGSTASKVCAMTLILTQDATGSRLVTWPASVKWPAGTAPALSTGANKVDVLSFVTVDNGTTWLGFLSGLDLR